MFPKLSCNTIDTFPLLEGTETFTRVPELRLMDAFTKPKRTATVLERLVPDKDRDAFWAAATGVKLVAVGFW